MINSLINSEKLVVKKLSKIKANYYIFKVKQFCSAKSYVKMLVTSSSVLASSQYKHQHITCCALSCRPLLPLVQLLQFLSVCLIFPFAVSFLGN